MNGLTWVRNGPGDMRWMGFWALVVSLGCGGGGGDDGDAGADGATPDSSVPLDAADRDVGTGSDAGPGDGGAGDDAGTMSCVPTGGGDALSGYCQQVMISVLRHDGAPTEVEARGITTSVGDGCRVVDRVELRSRAGVIQTLTPEDSRSGTFVARASEAAPELTSLCDGVEGRYDPFEVVIEGRTDGGTFTARCGADFGGGFGWPPDSVVTCHRNLPVGPTFMNDASVETFGGGFVSSSLFLAYPNEHGIGIDSVSSDLTFHVTPDPIGGGGFAEALSTTGWTHTIGHPTSERRFISVQLHLMEDPFGTEVCPMPDTGIDPPDDFPPILLVQLSGSGSTGAFESEGYLSSCYRIAF